ncbi:sodium- and chloride-dependent glycine transporter 2-like [Condylostylus longicornis]|uniref:sodium- and chloride-dependent glycine transporter 2-like n=1 Tax=Condylostylus longicornis TaxID=2530218 RepID=UPI00244DCA93|nr:sodium- and chloride-dependent glycine transporter 2-like [Condylostylus longicornis]XP_055375955.1 sodium- and chloride-dependent glycine transporter 2-like [Condylostylus longicornis]XP_055375956.1 sodium- and chloride-dependent glycine transporter 2-like [Condylostylus longicornis]XP_055375957.1 sodium- and chloride-dependent glycine transporter 2-like [Condylostylus longicornis]
MATILTSYDTGSKPFKPDISRGKWSSLTDFYTATLTHSFGIKTFSIIPLYAVSTSGILFIIPFMVGLLILSIPLYFMQSFMGQFSSSGYISVYRIAPLFKGIGFSILIMNLATICYSICLTSYTLTYFLASFNPELPWMTCNNGWNTHNCTVVQKFDENHTLAYSERWSTIEYFVHAVRQVPPEDEDEVVIVSWRLLLCTIIIWVMTTAITIQGVEFIGKLLRYFCYIILVCLVIFFLRIIFLERGLHFIYHFFIPKLEHFNYFEYFMFGIILPISLYGTGGGTVLTLSSYNNFHADIKLYSWINAIVLLNIAIIVGICSSIVEDYLEEHYNFRFFYYEITDFQLPFVGMPFFIGKLEIPNFWALVFYLMLLLGEFSTCVVQMLSITTAIFDEFELLRTYKKGITIAISCCLFIFSVCFTTNEGTKIVQNLFNASSITLCVVCFLDIMIVVWFYGREKFQRDVLFLMQGKMYQTWEFMILRFVTPVLILFVTLINIAIYLSELYYVQNKYWDIILITILVKALPTILIFSWILYKMKISTGNILVRLKRICVPTDWYPIDPGDKRRYDDVIGACSENIRDLVTNIDIVDDDDGYD